MGVLGLLLGLGSGGAARASTVSFPVRPDPPAVLLRLVPGSGPGAATRPRALSIGQGSGGPIRAIEAPFAGLLAGIAGSDPEEPLARTLRVTLAEGADPAEVARTLAADPGVEAAWVERRYRVAWADAERFLGSGPGSTPPAGARAGREPGLGGPGGALDPDDPLYVDGSQWGLFNSGSGPFGGVSGMDLHTRPGWGVTSGATSTRVAIIDTGVDLGQPELGGLLFDGSPRITLAYNSSVEPPGASPADSLGHGTMVAGVALARTNNGPLLDGRGVAGVAGGAGGDSAGCRVIAIKATPTRYGDALSTELAEGILYAVTHGARAINLSFGGNEGDDTLLDALSYAARRGCVVVCAAGNGQDERPQFPGYYARHGNGVSVAALRPDGTLARFSSRGPQIDVAAPGENIYSSYLTYENAYGSPLRNFAETGGTSFAAPFVTGLAGLVATLQPSLTDNEFQHLLRHTARDLGAPGRDNTFGWGLPDAGALLAYAAPPRGFVRGVTRAQSWVLLGEDSVTIDKSRRSVGTCNVNGSYRAERWEVRARIETPQLLETPLGIVRTHASNGWGAGPLLEYDLGFGEVVPGSATADGFTVRAYVYRIAAAPRFCAAPTPIGYLPVAPQDVSFGWSAFGLVDAAPVARFTHPAESGTTWSVDVPETLRWEASDPDTVSAIHLEFRRGVGGAWRNLAVLPGDARSFPFASPCAVVDESVEVRLTAIDGRGRSQESTSIVVAVRPARACLPGEDVQEPRFALDPVTPNPARGSVVLRYRRWGSGASGARAGISIHDARGRRLRDLPVVLEGEAEARWDGRDAAGRRVPSGIYVARLRADGRTATRRFVWFDGDAP